MNIFRKILKFIAPRSFRDGQFKCNELAKNLINKKQIERFLDAGCGDGTLTMQFAQKIEPKEIYGVEFIDDYCRQAEQKGIRCRQFDLNGPWEYGDSLFELILSSQTIEHLYNTRLYLEECYRCLKPGGQLIILTENLASWINIFALIFGWTPFSQTNINGWNLGNPLIWHINEPKDYGFQEKDIEHKGIEVLSHTRVLAYQGLLDLLEKVGFKNIKLYTKGYLPFYGKLSDFFCWIDRRHGHFLIATAQK